MGFTKVRGSCLCGRIEYEVEISDKRILNCYCTRCQKAHGAAFATMAFAKGETLRFLKGESMLHEYNMASGSRSFCGECGSRLMNFAPNKADYLGISLSCVDGDAGVGPVASISIETKAPWVEIPADPPSYEGMPHRIPETD